jgi:hypothetical protein
VIALPGRRQALLLGLVLGLPPLLVQLRLPPPRLDADAVEYYAHLRSLYADGDLDFANEFEHFGILARYDKAVPTRTGHRRTIFSVGPALLWMPFYAAGDAVARLAGDPAQGYSPWHVRAVCLASLAYGLAGLLLVHGVLRTLVSPLVALASVVALEYATFLYWYMVHEPVMSHALSFFMGALVLALWWPGRSDLGWRRALALGALIGLAATVRWQNGVLLLLPGLTLLPRLRRAPRAAVACGLLTLAAFAAGALPQMLAWRAIFGEYLLADPPHGRDFLRLSHPYLLHTFFSSRHGLFYWTPILWGGYLGYAWLVRREPRTALTLLLPLLAMSYVNVCSGDWWAGGSFSNRRFDSLLPLLALGLAQALAALQRAATARPGALLVAGSGALVLWNLLFMEQYRRSQIPRDDTVAFWRVARNQASLVAGAVGSPLAWPANWIFAIRHRLPPDQYDLMVGKYLFYRQNNLGGILDLGDDRADPLLGEGWGVRQACGSEPCREVRGRARIFAPLDVPETLDVTIRASGEGTLGLTVNGDVVGALPLSPELMELRVRVAEAHWRRELNEILLDGQARVARLAFERPGRR